MVDSDSDGIDSQYSFESDGPPPEQPSQLPPEKPLSATEQLKAMIKKEVSKGKIGQKLIDDENEAEK